MNVFINKTQYLEFLECAKNAWWKIHHPELVEELELSDFEKKLILQGHEAELLAQQMFPGGVLVGGYDSDAISATSRHIEQKTPVLFQPTFVYDTFLARNDILEFDETTGLWNLYEIKSTNSLGENTKEIDHVEDASFQSTILKNLGIGLNKVFVVHLNKEYVRGVAIDNRAIFSVDDVTEEIKQREQSTAERMQAAKDALLQDDEGALECLCVYKGRSAHCTTFKLSHPRVPEYSVHDLTRIGSSKKNLAALVDAGVFNLDDITEVHKLTDKQRMQVKAHQAKRPLVDTSNLHQELTSLAFPLYFLDYETYPSAIPLFAGFRPYQQVPFQFSLHVVTDPNTEPAHFEYLHTGHDDPSSAIIDKLHELIGPLGNIIVWNKSFEKMINSQLAERYPEQKDFLEGLNNRIYDLMDIFSKQFYIHPEFRGKVSIKKVLPVMVPELSYKALDIQEGGTASNKWFEMAHGPLTTEEKRKIADDLRKYCGLDTYAMYKIWKALMTELGQSVETVAAIN